ncbi:MAG: rhodanese-like domain-containing protein [Rhizobiaceae bacterium]|nr:rhodanese-like domain-containing protein [Rhizobiaceae bacterium]
MKLSYAGDVTVATCWETLREESLSQLVDVRTSAEWSFVGVPVLGSIEKDLILAEWQQYPRMQVNAAFTEMVIAELDKRKVEKSSSIFMLCRSGVRSMAAASALTDAGYERVYNVLGGFEGNTDANGHRATMEGWKFEGLPWRQ